MPSPTQQKGDQGETLARRFLEGKGYRFLTQGWQCRYGEIDLIMMDQDELVFCEVKLKKQSDWGFPEDMVTQKKRRHLVKTANDYLQKRTSQEIFFRFDTIAVTEKSGRYDIAHFIDTIREDR